MVKINFLGRHHNPMARIRKTETAVTVSASGSAAAPARRKTAASPRTPHTPAATEATAMVVESVAIRYSPAPQEIAELAYSYWVSRGYQGGCPEEDWLLAELELLQRTL
jgi:Protein of unknown function (DUF2934)